MLVKHAKHADGDLRSLSDPDLKKRTVSRSDRIRWSRALCAARECGTRGISPFLRCYNAAAVATTAAAGHGNCVSWIDFVARARASIAPNRGCAPPLPPRSANCYKWKTTALKKGSARACERASRRVASRGARPDGVKESGRVER